MESGGRSDELRIIKSSDVGYVSTQTLEGDSSSESLYRELAGANTLSDLSRRISAIVKDLGFTDFTFLRTDRVWNQGTGRGVLSSLPEDFIKEYIQHRVYEFDLVIPYGRANTRPIFATKIYDFIDRAPFETRLIRGNRRLLQMYKNIGCYEQYVIPVPAHDGGANVQLLLTCLGTKKREFHSVVTSVMPECRQLCKAIDAISSQQFEASLAGKENESIAIDEQSLQVLRRLVVADMTIAELAEEMCVSAISVHQHIAAARKALGVKTNVGAITKAIKAGLINPC